MAATTVGDLVHAPTRISSVADVAAELARLELEERATSYRRRQLHEQIDEIYLGAPLVAEQVAQLDRLEDLEREVSIERRLLHARIDHLRADIGLPAWRKAHGLDDAA